MNEADRIFDAVGKFSRIVHLSDELNKKNKQIKELESKVCGNCDHWMKSSCKPEKVDKQFKSCNSHGCKDFQIKGWVVDLISERNTELKEIEKNLDIAKASSLN